MGGDWGSWLCCPVCLISTVSLGIGEKVEAARQEGDGSSREGLAHTGQALPGKVECSRGCPLPSQLKPWGTWEEGRGVFGTVANGSCFGFLPEQRGGAALPPHCLGCPPAGSAASVKGDTWPGCLAVNYPPSIVLYF